MNRWYTYVVECSDTSLYTGVTTDISRRICEHNENDLKGAKYTRTRRPVKLVHVESYETKSDALKREWEIKKLRRESKLSLLSSCE